MGKDKFEIDEDEVMPKKSEKADTGLSKQDLKDIVGAAVAAAVSEAKKPYVSEADVVAAEQAQAARKQSAALVKTMAANKHLAQVNCTHLRRNGSCRAVFIADDLGGYLLCQKCQAVVRPGNTPKDYKGTDIYDTEKFNFLFQQAQPDGAMVD